MPEILATVAILTYNGERYIERILQAVVAQELDGPFDVLVIDSGSTDATLDIVRSFPQVRLLEIPNREFGHGRTRDLAARSSSGEYTAYLTHDAIPLTDLWLHHLIAPMRSDSSVAGVMGRQVPRPGCLPLQKYEINGVFANAGDPHDATVFRLNPDMSEAEFARASFYSDVNSAARTSVLTGPVPYRDVPYAEDQYFGQDILRHGLAKAYAPLAAVEHSNDLTLREYGPRVFDETLGLRRLGMGHTGPMPLREAWRLTLRGIVGDTLRIRRDRDLSWLDRLRWWCVNPLFHVARWRGVRAATLVSLDDADAVAKGSLEHRRKRDPSA